MLIRLDTHQFQVLEGKLERAGIRPGMQLGSRRLYNRIFYQALSSLGYEDFRKPGHRCTPPDYTELGMTRKAGRPTSQDIEKYADVTGGGVLTKDGWIIQGLLFDNDLITDRYSVATLNVLTGLYDRYLGRANDFDHSFDTTHARCRIIDLGIGADPGVSFHKDSPIGAIQRLSPANIYAGTYTALFGTLAFPAMSRDDLDVIDRVQAALIKDISIAWSSDDETTVCSICLSPLERFWFWSYCAEHGFPGGKDETTGEVVVAILDGVTDAFTFGLVSDGAVKRAMLVADPTRTMDEARSDYKPNIGKLTLPDGSVMDLELSPTYAGPVITNTITQGDTHAED